MKTPNDRMQVIKAIFRGLPLLKKALLTVLLQNLRALWMLTFVPWILFPFVAMGQGTEHDRIEIIQLSFSEADDSRVEILFRLEEAIEAGSVLFHRYDPQGDIYEEIDELPVEDIERDQSGLYYLYRDNIPAGADPPFRYYLAFDEDGTGADAWTYRHQTILLKEILFDLCRGSFELEWDHYTVLDKPGASDDIIPPFFSHYRILLNGLEFDEVAFDEASGTQTHFLDIPEPGTYTIRLEAVDAPDPDNRTRFSLSGRQEITVDWAIPSEVVVDYVSINEAGDAKMMIRGDAQHDEFAYRIFLSDSPSANFEQVGEIRRPANNPFEFVDELSARDEDAGSNIWYYRVEAVLIQDDELCEEAVLTSAPESTIFLFVEQERQEAHTWEVALGFDHEPFSASYTYDIARRIGEEGDFEIVASDQAGSYVADLSDLLPFAGDVFFRVEGEAYNVQGEADNGWQIFSNVVRVNMESEVNIPNAFRPTSDLEENREFRPHFVGFEPENYRLVVLDRNGLEVFSSANFEVGWDGTRGGTAMPEGTYVYHLRYTDAGDESHEKKGVVYLVR